jgi:hypothetical protein
MSHWLPAIFSFLNELFFISTKIVVWLGAGGSCLYSSYPGDRSGASQFKASQANSL